MTYARGEDANAGVGYIYIYIDNLYGETKQQM